MKEIEMRLRGVLFGAVRSRQWLAAIWAALAVTQLHRDRCLHDYVPFL